MRAPATPIQPASNRWRRAFAPRPAPVPRASLAAEARRSKAHWTTRRRIEPWLHEWGPRLALPRARAQEPMCRDRSLPSVGPVPISCKQLIGRARRMGFCVGEVRVNDRNQILLGRGSLGTHPAHHDLITRSVLADDLDPNLAASIHSQCRARMHPEQHSDTSTAPGQAEKRRRLAGLDILTIRITGKPGRPDGGNRESEFALRGPRAFSSEKAKPEAEIKPLILRNCYLGGSENR